MGSGRVKRYDWYVREPPLKEVTVGIAVGYGSSFHNLVLDEQWRRKSDNQGLQLPPGKYSLRLRLSIAPPAQQSGLATSKLVQFEVIKAN